MHASFHLVQHHDDALVDGRQGKIKCGRENLMHYSANLYCAKSRVWRAINAITTHNQNLMNCYGTILCTARHSNRHSWFKLNFNRLRLYSSFVCLCRRKFILASEKKICVLLFMMAMIFFPNLIIRKILLANFFHLKLLIHVMLCGKFLEHLIVLPEILNYKPLNIYTWNSLFFYSCLLLW